MSDDHAIEPIIVRGTEILPTDPARLRFQKLARITLDSMVQFVGPARLATAAISSAGSTGLRRRI
jgi:hypothetical protein